MAAHGGGGVPEKDEGIENPPGEEKGATATIGVSLSHGDSPTPQNAPSGALSRPVRPGPCPAPPRLVPFDPPGPGASAAPGAWPGRGGGRGSEAIKA